MFEGLIAKKLGGGMFPEKELLNIVHRHAMVAAIVLMLPAPFLEQIFFLGCLWHMYHKLAEYVGEEMGCFTILLGVGVNILLALIYSFILELLPLVGWLTTGAICYLQFYISGKIYINVLREQHQNTRHNTTQISTDRQPKQITKSSIDSIQPAKVLSNDTTTVPTPTEVPQPETIADIPTSIKNDGSSVLPDEKTTADSDKYEDKATSTKEISSKTVIKFSLVILFSILAIAVVYELCQSDKDIDNNISKVSHTDVVSPPTTTNVNVSYITVFDFLKEFYNNYVFYGAKELTPAIADKYLTKTLAQKLIDDYPYDVDGDCYAVWELRSGFQDGPTNESKIMSVKKLSGDNYEVKIKDMGIIGTINLQVIRYGDEYRINSIGPFMQETTEAYDKHQNVQQSQFLSDEQITRWDLSGEIDGKYQVYMALSEIGDEIYGSYYYASQGEGNKIDLDCKLWNRNTGKLVMIENYKGKLLGTFQGTLSIGNIPSFIGTYTNTKGTKMPVSLSEKDTSNKSISADLSNEFAKCQNSDFPELAVLKNPIIKQRIVNLVSQKHYNEMLERCDMSGSFNRSTDMYEVGSFRAHCAGYDEWIVNYNIRNQKLTVLIIANGIDYTFSEE